MDSQIDNNFKWHEPTDIKTQQYEFLRKEAKVIALWIDANVPNSREKSLAMTKLEEAVMWANAGIARN